MVDWHALAVRVARRDLDTLSAALFRLGAVGLQEDVLPGDAPRYRQPWDDGPEPPPPAVVLLRAWFEVRPDEEEVRAVLDGREGTWRVDHEEDWANDWKRHFQPVRVSDRLVVAAPWHELPGAIVIEPGNAFGTGEHVTTRACLRAVDRYAKPGAALLDLGCGSGVLALAGAKLGMRAHGVDVDPAAVAAARAAASANGLAATFDGTPIEALTGRWDLVVANLYAELLVRFAPDIRRLARGPIALAGILADRADRVREAFAGLAVLHDEREGDWVSLVYDGSPSA